MERTQLGATGLEISRVGFGAWAIGGGNYEFGWGPQDDDDSIAAIRRAVELGVNWIDTAAVYGFGRSERVVARALEGLQPPYSLLTREAEDDVLPYVQREGIGVIVASPMASGLLSGRMTRERVADLPADDWRKYDDDFQEPQLSRHLAVVERLRHVAERHGVLPGAVAVAWTLRHPAVDGAIVGFRHPGQVAPLVPAANLEGSRRRR